MNRRGFFQTLGGIFGTGVTVNALQDTNQELPEATGPYCVEIYSPNECRERGLPLFDNMRQAQNFAYARQKSMKRDNITAGKILITLENGAVCECITWGSNWSQTMSYVSCVADRWKVV